LFWKIRGPRLCGGIAVFGQQIFERPTATGGDVGPGLGDEVVEPASGRTGP